MQSVKTEEGYAQSDPHMRKMEEEAYLQGNMMFRDWEDSCKAQNMILPSTIGEQKMSNLKNLIREKIMEGLLAEKKKMPMKTDTEDLDGDGKTTDKIPAFVNKKQKKSKGGEIPDQLKPHVKAKQGKKEDKEEEKVEEAGCASRKGDPRVRRQEPDRLREEEDIEEISYYDGTHDKPIDHKDAEKKVRSMMNMFRDEIIPTLQALGKEFGKGEGNLGGEALKGLDDVYNVFLKINYPGKYKNLEEMRRGAPQAVQAAKKKKEDEIRKAREKKGQVREKKVAEAGYYKNPDRDEIDSGIGKKAMGSMGKAHDDKVKAARKKKAAARDAADRARLDRMASTGEGGWYKVGRKKKKKVKENELANIKKGQDSIRNLNEQRNQKLNDELMRRLLK